MPADVSGSKSCPFCSIDPSRIVFANDLVIAIWDGFPVSSGHLLIIPQRHTPAWSNLTSAEKAAVWLAVDKAQALVSERFRPDGFNVGLMKTWQQANPSFIFICTLSHAMRAMLATLAVGCGT